MQYTVLNIEEINVLTKVYNIGKIISAKVLSGGSENTNYLIESKDEKYVLTICEQKSIEEANHLAQLLEHLAKNDFSTSKVIRTQTDELTSIYQNKPILLKSFLAGEIIEDLSSDLMELIGIQMGRLHQIKSPDYLPTKLAYGIEHFDLIAAYAENSPFHIWLKKIKTQITPYLSADLPKALIHSDVFFSNVIIEKGKNRVTIMDFEEATYYYRIFDIGMAIVGLCKANEKIKLEKVSALLKAYVQEIDLSEQEKNALQDFTVYAAAAMCFWRHKNFNYVNPTPGMEEHYMELKNIADFVNALPAHAFRQIMDEL